MAKPSVKEAPKHRQVSAEADQVEIKQHVFKIQHHHIHKYFCKNVYQVHTENSRNSSESSSQIKYFARGVSGGHTLEADAKIFIGSSVA